MLICGYKEKLLDKNILVVGGTGMLGKPVCDEFINRGWRVVVGSTNPEKAKEIFGEKAETVFCDVTDIESLRTAFENVDNVYLNLNSKLTEELYNKIEIEGTKNAAIVAAEKNIRRIGNISGASSRGVEGGVIYLDAKVKAERALMESGVPYSIFRPSWFYETLPTFIQDGKAVVLGDQPCEFGWLAAADYAHQVVNAYESDEAANKCFYNLGPEKMTMKQALAIYCEKKEPNLKPQTISFMMAKIASAMPGYEKLKVVIPFFEYFSSIDENVDPTETDELLGANKMTLKEWLEK